MMMEKLKVALYVLLLAGVFTACSDDDTPAPDPVVPDVEVEDGEPSAEELAEMAALDKFTAANSVIRALAMVSVLPDNWETTTFEPQAGVVVDEANPDIRNMVASDAEDAENYFLNIVPDLGLNGNTWSHEGVGSLTFRAVNEADCYAVIDVNLVQMPGLKQLRFVPEEAVGDNAFKGVPFYSVGDIVMDRDGVYWMCIRPAGGPRNKDYAYFVSFNEGLILKSVESKKQNIYALGSNGKFDKNQTLENSGEWYYAKNLIEERMVPAAAQAFAMMKFDTGEYFFAEVAKDLYNEYGFDVNKFDNEEESDRVFSCNIAYGNYVSNKHTKVRQEKYLQPFMRVTVTNYKGQNLGYSFGQLVEKVSLDPKTNGDSTPYLLSLTSDYNPTAFQLLYGDKVNIKGYPKQSFTVTNYLWKFGENQKLAQHVPGTSYMNGFLNEKVLLMVQTSIKDHGKANKNYTLVYHNVGPFYWEALQETQRIVYDVKHNGKVIEDLLND